MHTTTKQTQSTGDKAVDGLLAGLLAGLAMALTLAGVALASRESPGVMMGRFDVVSGNAAATGALLHLAVSGIYGAVFALIYYGVVGLRPRSQPFGWLMGLLYGLLLWALARGVFLPAAASPLLEIPTFGFILAHVIYGLVLGYRVQKG